MPKKSDEAADFVQDVMADDWEEATEGESRDAWLPPKLVLSDCKPSPELLEELAGKIAPDDSPLRQLVLAGVPLGKPPGAGRLPRGAAAPPLLISKLLQPGGCRLITAVHLHNCALKDAGAVYLAELVKGGWKCEDLDMGFNEVGDLGCQAMAEASSSVGNRLVRLQLRINRVRNEGAKSLADALYSNDCVLEWVSLASNVVGSKGLRALMMAAGQCKTLRYLDCSQQKEAVWQEDDFAAGARRLAGVLNDGGGNGLVVDLSGIDGMALASLTVDCGAVDTEYGRRMRCPYLSIQVRFLGMIGTPSMRGECGAGTLLFSKTLKASAKSTSTALMIH